MKKFISAILLCFLSFVCVFSFTACRADPGDSGEEELPPDDVKTVTEKQWKKIFGLFDEENYKNVNLTLNCSALDGNLNYSYVFDYANKKLHYSYCLSTEGEDDDEIEYYFWQGGEFAYFYKKYTKGPNVDESKTYTDFDSMFKTYLTEFSETYAKYGLKDKYGEFTYNEETEEYTAQLQCDSPLPPKCNMTFKFAGAKLCKWVTGYEDEGVFETSTIEYVYGETVTIPQNILDMPTILN